MTISSMSTIELEAEVERLRDLSRRACDLADSASRSRDPRADSYRRDVAKLRGLITPAAELTTPHDK